MRITTYEYPKRYNDRAALIVWLRTWVINSADENKTEAVELNFLRAEKGLRYQSETIREDLKTEPITQSRKLWQIEWVYNHITKMEQH